MNTGADKKEDLVSRKERLEQKIASIRADLKSGLDPDPEEQAVQLENYEVLLQLLQQAEDELFDVNQKIMKIDNSS